MASSFDADFAVGAVPNLLSRFGAAVTYTPIGGADVPLLAMLSKREVEEIEGETGSRVNYVYYATITRDPASSFGGVESPLATAVMTIHGSKYAIDGPPDLTSSMAQLRCVRAGSREKSREGFRSR